MKVHFSMFRDVQRLFLWAGVVMLGYAGGTAAYSEAFQRYQERKFENIRAAPVSKAPDLHEGDLVGRLEVPRIGLSVIVLQGIEESTLLSGVGHVPGTPLPGIKGNVAIAGHRDTFFRKLKGIVRGDRIRVSIGARVHEYVVASTETVDPENTSVMESGSRSELTLITCYPFYFVGSAPKRFIVHALEM
jgi:sortase A